MRDTDAVERLRPLPDPVDKRVGATVAAPGVPVDGLAARGVQGVLPVGERRGGEYGREGRGEGKAHGSLRGEGQSECRSACGAKAIQPWRQRSTVVTAQAAAKTSARAGNQVGNRQISTKKAMVSNPSVNPPR